MFSYLPLPALTLPDKREAIAFLASEERCFICQIQGQPENTWTSARVQAPRPQSQVLIQKNSQSGDSTENKARSSEVLLPKTWTPKTQRFLCSKSRCSTHPYLLTEEFKIFMHRSGKEKNIYICVCINIRVCGCERACKRVCTLALQSQRTHFPKLALCQEFHSNVWFV